jgi:hypothetical protein
MSKKRAQRQRKQAKKKPFRIVKQQNQSKKFVEAKPNLETEPRNIETQKIPNSAKRIPDKDLEKEKPNVLNYYNNSLYNIFYTYSSDTLNNYLEQEKNKENLVQITEETLSIFAISKEQRKYAFKYLYETIKPYNMSQKLYFKTVLIFDSFLINYSRNNTHLTCSQFFLSKHDKKLSETKLIMFILCCFYLVNQTLNTQNFELKCLQKWDEKDEYTYDELNQLIYTILRGIDCNIDLFGLYDFLNLFSFDLNKKFQNVINANKFMDFFNRSLNIFSVKVVQDTALNDIIPSAQSLGIIMFSLEYTKFMLQNNFQNEQINILVDNWIKNVKNILLNNSYQDIKRVIHWLNDYVNTH